MMLQGHSRILPLTVFVFDLKGSCGGVVHWEQSFAVPDDMQVGDRFERLLSDSSDPVRVYPLSLSLSLWEFFFPNPDCWVAVFCWIAYCGRMCVPDCA